MSAEPLPPEEQAAPPQETTSEIAEASSPATDASESKASKRRIGLVWLQWLFLRASLVVSVLLIIVFVVRELTDRSYTIQPFSLPDNFAQYGYNGEMVASKVLDNLTRMIEIANERRTVREVNEYNEAANRIRVNVEVSGIGISPQDVSSYLKRVFGINPRIISGGIIRKDNILELYLSVSGLPSEIITERIDSSSVHVALDRLTTRAGEAILMTHNHLLAGLYFYEKQDYGKAVENFRASIFEQPSFASKAYAHWGDVMLVTTNDTIGPSRALRKALSINPKEATAYRILGTMYYSESMAGKSEQYYRKSLELDPTAPHTWFHLANRILIPARREDEALACLQKAYDLNPLFVQDLVRLLYLRGDYKLAYEKLQVLRNEYPQRGLALEFAILEALGDSVQAEMTARSVRRKEVFSDGLNELAYDQELRKNYKVGFRLVNLAIAYDSNAPLPYTTLAELCAFTNDKEGFYAALEKALQRGLEVDDLTRYEGEEPYKFYASEDRFRKLKERYLAKQ